MADILVTIYLIAMVCMFVAVVAGGLLFWFRRAVFNELKLKKLMKFGYIICRLKRVDKTEKEVVARPSKDTNGVKFPGVEGTYMLDDASVILKDRKFPVYEWREGETAPINHEKEYQPTETECPSCHDKIRVNVEMPKSISPSLLDNLILKVKTLGQMLEAEKLRSYLLIGGIVILAGLAVVGFLVYDTQTRLPEIIAPVIKDACKSQIQNAGSIVIP